MGSITHETNEVPKTPLKLVFLTLPIAGHMLHIVDTASTFAMHGVTCIIITTHANVPFIQNSVPKSVANINDFLNIRLLDFPYEAVGLPPGIENFSNVTSIDMRPKISDALKLLQKPTEDLIKEISPDCIVSDMFYPWTSDFAREVGIPRVVFRGTGMFPMCCWNSIKSHVPHESVTSDDEKFTLPGLPGDIVMTKSTLPDWVRNPNGYTMWMKMIDAAESKSFGVIVNSFTDLERDYEEYYKLVTGLKVWTIGPIALHVGRNEDLDGSGEWVEWLDKKEAGSVIYVSFGGSAKFPTHQLKEIAAGLELSGRDFVWVVRAGKDHSAEEWSLQEFKEKMRESGQGLIIEGWVPQLMFLEHTAVGAMVTHVGWGTMLEGITAGLPLVTWPLYAEQFYNERLVVDVLKIGVGVGVSEFCGLDDIGKKETIGRQSIEAAVRLVMGDSEEAVAMRQRVMELSEASKKAVQDGGSSKANIQNFLNDLTILRSLRNERVKS
ncbi:soyasapogenol B glucuronide galactosyltransferase-like [Silene latifolia]|uniref:soyasapogenol B glucuronide galactosyltransferase-like n=1 Tax=Silene latifolia TaxID=37657 RepID=UPI003D7803BD